MPVRGVHHPSRLPFSNRRKALVTFLRIRSARLSLPPGGMLEVVKRTPAARRIARDLQKELEAHGAAHGVSLSWSVPELAIIEQIQDQIDRKSEVMAAY